MAGPAAQGPRGMAEPTMEQVLANGAHTLRQASPLADAEPAVRALLCALDYDKPGDPGPFAAGSEAAHRAWMLQAAAGFTRLFQLAAPDAPGLHVFGAELDPRRIRPGGTGLRTASSSGVGWSRRAAFEGCVGEGIEFLAQIETDQDQLVRARLADHADAIGPVLAADLAGLIEAAGLPPDAPIDWIGGLALTDGAPVSFPADLCLRRGSRHSLIAPAPLSIGCAAGPSFESAALHALLELIERDAAAHWWRGGRRGRLIPLDHPACGVAGETVAAMRLGRFRRRAWLLDITTDLGVPCVAAISVEPDGSGFACGLSAGPGLAAAVRGAILELAQMELAHAVVAAKRREGGDAALNEADRAHLRRRDELDVEGCLLLHPLPPGPVAPDIDPGHALGRLVAYLAARGLPSYAVDLTRPGLGVPVVRIFCPDLDKEPSRLFGPRLRATIAAHGGGGMHTGGVPLM